MNEPRLIIEPKKYGAGTDSSVISFRIPKTLLAKIEEIAKKTGRTRNEILLLCTEFAVNHLDIPQGEKR